jgi:hypothetical protein
MAENGQGNGVSEEGHSVDLSGRFKLDVGQRENGDYVVDQTEVETKEVRRIAVFPREEKVLNVLDEETGKTKFATRDLAEIRAIIFAKIYVELASSGQLGL